MLNKLTDKHEKIGDLIQDGDPIYRRAQYSIINPKSITMGQVTAAQPAAPLCTSCVWLCLPVCVHVLGCLCPAAVFVVIKQHCPVGSTRHREMVYFVTCRFASWGADCIEFGLVSLGTTV